MVKRSRFEGNEIILTSDMNNNSDSLVKNIDTWSEFLGENSIVTGMEVSELAVPAMSVQISRGVARNSTVGTLLNGESFTSVTIQPADGLLDRRDTVEIRRLIEDVTPGSRQIKDPISGNISVTSIETEQEYKTEVKVIAGVPGSGVAVAAEAGWLKIAEILVPAASSSVINSRIYNVDSVESGNENTNWTINKTDIYRNGSVSFMKSQIQRFDKEGIPIWIDSPNIRYYANTSHVSKNGNVYQARLGDDISIFNTGKDPETNPLWWKLIYTADPVAAYDITEAVAYETKGVLVERYGKHYTSTGLAGNLGKDPSIPANAKTYWRLSKGADVLEFEATEGLPVSAGMHVITDRSHAQFAQNILVDKIKKGSVTYNEFVVMIDGSTVTGNATLEAIFDVGGPNEYPYLDRYAPDVAGTRTLLDLGEVITAPMSVGGENDTLAEMLDDRFQGHKQEYAKVDGGALTLPSVTFITGGGNESYINDGFVGDPSDDGVNGTPRTGLTTRPKEFTVGASYIVVMQVA